MATLTDRVSAFVGDVAMKSPVRVHASTNIVLSDPQTIDGVAVVAGDRVSVGGQTSSINNGIYDVSASAWTRSVDCDGAKDIVGGSLFYIVEGTAFTGVLAAFGGTGAKTPGTDALTITANPITITAASMASAINAATNKATPVGADLFGIRDSVTGLLNKLTWANLVATVLGTTVAISVTRVADLALTDIAYTTILWDTEESDSTNAYDPATGRFTPLRAGWYHVDFQLLAQSTGAATLVSCSARLRLNGISRQLADKSLGDTIETALLMSSSIYFNGTTDYIDVQVYIDGTAPMKILGSASYNRLTACFLRA